MQNLKEKTIIGIVWAIAERVGIRVAQFLPSIILARLLTPEQFGLIGMLAIFIALTQIFLDSGFGAALIQKKEITYADECTIFYFNVFIGCLAIGVFYVAAPWVGAFYQQPDLIPLLRVLSLDILIKSFALIQTTLLTRALDFKTQVKANVVASVGSGLVGIGAAYLGWGTWSLVAQTISSSLFRLLILWGLSPWRPARVFHLASLKNMFGFGSNILLSSLLSTFFDNIFPVIFGKLFSVSIVGFYTRANMLKTMVLETTAFAFNKVLFPAMSMIQDDTARLQRAYRKFMVIGTFIHFPLVAGLIVVARPLIVLLFSDQWLESVSLFQLLCFTALMYPISMINLNVLRAKGRSDLSFRVAVFHRVSMMFFIALGYPWGIQSMLAGQIVNSFIIYFVNSHYAAKFVNYPTAQQIQDFLPNLLLSAIMAGAMWLVGLALPPNNWILLSGQSLAGILVYGILARLLCKNTLLETLSIGQTLWAMRKRK